MKNYINGVLYGIKTSIKIMAYCKDINTGIKTLCLLQNELKTRSFKNNLELWQYIQFNFRGSYWSK